MAVLFYLCRWCVSFCSVLAYRRCCHFYNFHRVSAYVTGNENLTLMMWCATSHLSSNISKVLSMFLEWTLHDTLFFFSYLWCPYLSSLTFYFPFDFSSLFIYAFSSSQSIAAPHIHHSRFNQSAYPIHAETCFETPTFRESI